MPWVRIVITMLDFPSVDYDSKKERKEKEEFAKTQEEEAEILARFI